MIHLTKFIAVVLLCCFASPAFAQDRQGLEGSYDAQIESPGGPIRFGLILSRDKDVKDYTTMIRNGSEMIVEKDTKIELASDGVRGTINMAHYDSKITFTANTEAVQPTLKGEWKKRRGKDEWVTMEFAAVHHPEAEADEVAALKKFVGRWEVNFDKSEDPAVAIFKMDEDNESLTGTFLTTTGDYRYLDGRIDEKGNLELSCFDGAHAFLFRCSMDDEQKLSGDFWSSNTWHEPWTAKRNDKAKLPDAFRQTTLVAEHQWSQFKFPDLDGKMTALDDPKFAGKARIIYVFGSWCPNCHDAARYLSALDKKYNDLSVLGLAFELTGDQERDAEQVRKYLKKHGAEYPVLLAGLADKKLATKSIPFLDRVRSYPTTIFIDRDGVVHAIHTGFTGPATGEAYEELKSKFEETIEGLLK